MPGFRELVRVRLSPRDAHAWLELALAEMAEGKLEDARSSAETALTRIEDGDAAVAVGALLEELAGPEAALRAYSRGTEIAPGDPLPHVALGRALRARGRAEASLEPLRAAVRLEPERIDNHVELGHALRAAGQRSAARRSFEAAYALDPGHVGGALALAAELRDAGKADRAAGILKSLVRRHPDSSDVLVNACAACIEAGDLAVAVQIARDAVRHAPDSAAAHCNLGVAYLRRGSYGPAAESLRTAVDLDPGLAEGHLALATAMARKLSRSRATAHAKRALELSPEGTPTWEGARRLLDEMTGPATGPLPPLVTPGESVEAFAEFSGELGAFPVPDLLEVMRTRRSTGSLLLGSRRGFGEVALLEGEIVGASASHQASLGEMLVGRELLTRDELTALADEQARSGRDLAMLVVEHTDVSVQQLEGVLMEQVLSVLQELMQWTEGNFAFRELEAGVAAPARPPYAPMSVSRLLLEAFRRQDEEAAK